MSGTITVMFSITRNLYDKAPGVIYNLIKTNPEVWRIYLFIEDDDFPYPLDKRVRVININHFPKYIEGGPNEGNAWTHMAYTRCFVSQLLLEDKIIYLDLDLYFYNKLDRLWNIDFEGNYVCGVSEDNATLRRRERYINTGVLLLNLRAMHRDHIDYDICKLIQTRKLQFPDQDAINEVCKGKIKFIHHNFNYSSNTLQTETENIPLTIVHTIGVKLWDKRSKLYKNWQENTNKALGINN